jgi:hypothetical protein
VAFGARLTVRAPASRRQVSERIAARARGRKQPMAPQRLGRVAVGTCVQVMDSVGSLTS